MIQHLSEMTLFLNYCIFSGGAEALLSCGGKLYHLLIAYFLGYTCAKYYENQTMLFRVIAKNVGDVFLRHTVEDRGCITESIHILVHRQNETEMFSDHDETIPSIAAVLAPSAACSMLAVQKQHFITIFLFALAP